MRLRHYGNSCARLMKGVKHAIRDVPNYVLEITLLLL